MVSFPFPFPGIRNSFYSETLHTNFLSFIQQSLFLGYLLCLALAAFPPQSSTCLLRVHIRSCCRARELGTRAAVYGVRQASAVLEAPLRTIQARQQIMINLSRCPNCDRGAFTCGMVHKDSTLPLRLPWDGWMRLWVRSLWLKRLRTRSLLGCGTFFDIVLMVS